MATVGVMVVVVLASEILDNHRFCPESPLHLDFFCIVYLTGVYSMGGNSFPTNSAYNPKQAFHFRGIWVNL